MTDEAFGAIRRVGVGVFWRTRRLGRYGGLKLAYSPGWNWRFLEDEAFGLIRQVECGVYGGLNVAYRVSRAVCGDTPG